MDLHHLLGDEADSLLAHSAKAFPSEGLVLPGPDFLDRVFRDSDRPPAVLRNLGTVYRHGRLGGTGYLSILPVDQGIEHSAAASFAKNPLYFDPANLCELALAGECSAIATTLGCARRGLAAVRAPDPLHREAQPQRLPPLPEHVRPGTVRFGAAGRRSRRGRGGRDDLLRLRAVGPPDCTRSPTPFAEAHRQGLFTVLWCYLRNPAFKKDGVDYHLSADLTGQANHLGVTIEADIIKQKQPENNGGYTALGFGRTDPLGLRPADDRPPDRPDPLAGRELLRGPDRADQLGRRVEGRRRPRPGRAHRGHQQAGRRAGPHRRAARRSSVRWTRGPR